MVFRMDGREWDAQMSDRISGLKCHPNLKRLMSRRTMLSATRERRALLGEREGLIADIPAPDHRVPGPILGPSQRPVPDSQFGTASAARLLILLTHAFNSDNIDMYRLSTR
jgi:hypothetical protein